MTTTKARIQFVCLAAWIGFTSQAFADWSVSTSISPLTGVKTTTLETSAANYGRFVIYCSGGIPGDYYLSTDYVNGDGYVAYRVGNNPVVYETWSESQNNGYQVLLPPSFPNDGLNLIRTLYLNWDFVFLYNSFSDGSESLILEMNTSGLAEAIDETRAACNLPTDLFPPGNGWGQLLPSQPPADAREATYVPGATNQFRLIAWRAINAQGKWQLLARLGDENGPCSGPFYVTDHRLYVTQNEKVASVVSGKDFYSSCTSPVIVALNGDFDASEAFTLTSYPFHYHTTDPGSPMASVSFDAIAPTPPVTAVEYYYAAWDYYFETAFPDEIAGLDGGAFGGVWKRTGETFKVWPEPSGSASPTCRFFSTSFAPKSSHFYTPYPAECDYVKTTNPNWQFESIAFFVQLIDASGNCPPGMIPLYRLYNNGRGGAPNHRYTTSLTVFNDMAAKGWQFEGHAVTKVFACVPA